MASDRTLNGVGRSSFVYLQSERAGHRQCDGSSFMFADGFAPAVLDVYLGGEGRAVAGQSGTIRGLEQPKRVREFRQRTESPSRNPATTGLDEAIRRRLPPHEAFRQGRSK